MPEISRFLGVIIAMYYKDHPPPYFHAKYEGQTGVFTIADLKLVEGNLPKRVISLVLEWVFEHREALMEDWDWQWQKSHYIKSHRWYRRVRMHYVKKVKYISGYKLQLTFEDGSRRFVDLEPHLDGEIFAPLKNIEYFKKVQVNRDIDTIMWENGADLSPDFLYEIAELKHEIAEA